MHALQLVAGQTAAKRIEENGLTPELVRLVMGASGGAKWLVLKGLDQFVFGDWLPKAQQTIPMIGSSIGSWRITFAAHPKPAEMIQRFKDRYFDYRYQKGDKAADITRESYVMFDQLFSAEDRAQIIANKKRPIHIVAVRCKGPVASKITAVEIAGLMASAGANMVKRELIGKFYDRAVFHTGDSVALSDQWNDYNRIDIPLLPEALGDALMASGSIPFVVDPVENIVGAPEGVYRDGGMIDYHFDVPWRIDEGIVLYPHFYGHLVPGWFDKKIKKRWAGSDVLDHQLILAPSDEFVASLPYGAITDRKNFTDFDNETRLKYWETVVGESERLGEEFAELLEKPGALMDRMRIV